MRARDERIRPAREGMAGHLRRESEVRRPCGVDHERHTCPMRSRREAFDVGERADVGRVAHQHSARVGVGTQRRLDRIHRHRTRQPRSGVDLRTHPDRAQPREDEAEQHRPMEGARDDHTLTGASESEDRGLVGVRGSADREPAPVHSPRLGCARLGGRQQGVILLHGVESGEHRDVPDDDVAHQVAAVLVPGNAEGHRAAVAHVRGEAQPRLEERRIGGVAARIARVWRGHSSAPRNRPTASLLMRPIAFRGRGRNPATDISPILSGAELDRRDWLAVTTERSERTPRARHTAVGRIPQSRPRAWPCPLACRIRRIDPACSVLRSHSLDTVQPCE